MAFKLNLDPEKLQQPEFQIGPTTFKVHKMPALEGWNLLEAIREQVGKSLNPGVAGILAVGENATPSQLVGALQLVLSLPAGFVEKVRREIFKHIYFKNRMAVDWLTLEGSEDTAFVEVEPGEIYQVLGRGLAVNFFDSFRALSELN